MYNSIETMLNKIHVIKFATEVRFLHVAEEDETKVLSDRK